MFFANIFYSSEDIASGCKGHHSELDSAQFEWHVVFVTSSVGLGIGDELYNLCFSQAGKSLESNVHGLLSQDFDSW